jgi:hypothetical protein
MGRDILAPDFWNFDHPIMIYKHVAVEDNVIISEIMTIWWDMPHRAFDGFLREKYRHFAIECRAWWLRRHKLQLGSQEGLECHFQHIPGCGGGTEYGVSFHHYQKEWNAVLWVNLSNQKPTEL